MEVEAAGQASKAQWKVLVQELEPAETTLEVHIEAVEQGSRSLVVVLTTAQAGLRLILQMQILRQIIRAHQTLTPKSQANVGWAGQGCRRQSGYKYIK